MGDFSETQADRDELQTVYRRLAKLQAENHELIGALRNIRKHFEIVMGAGVELSCAWKIADAALQAHDPVPEKKPPASVTLDE